MCPRQISAGVDLKMPDASQKERARLGILVTTEFESEGARKSGVRWN
jgi:hypothetical protein